MRQVIFHLILVLLLVAPTSLEAQQFFPVKLNKKWGLINTAGELVQPAVYDAIGEFKHYGYAVMQRNGLVGLFGPNGKESFPPRYDDIKVLDQHLVAVMENNAWRVVNHQGVTVLNEGYQRVQILRPGYLTYKYKGKWGLIKNDGAQIIPARYDKIDIQDEHYFLTQEGDQIGLVDSTGLVLVKNQVAEIKIISPELICFRQGRFWGAVDNYGLLVIRPTYDSFQDLGNGYVKLFAGNQRHFYALSCSALIKQDEYDDFYAFSEKYLVVKKEQRLGLVDACGMQVLPPLYQEIQAYGPGLFRVNFDGSWGVVNQQNRVILPLAFQFISPMHGAVCVVKQNHKFGLINSQGDTLVPITYDRIELEGFQAKAINDTASGQEDLSVFTFDQNGQLTNNSQFSQHWKITVRGSNSNTAEEEQGEPSNYQLKNFEWFYDPAEDRWGLRNIFNGQVQIEPTFDFIKVDQQLGYTLVGIWKSNDYEFERSSFRFDMILGLVLNDLGILVTEVDFLDVRIDDFRRGLPTARVVFSNGRHGLIDRLGRTIRQDITYIGSFQNGLARVSFTGRLSGKRNQDLNLGLLRHYLDDIQSPNYMLDYTQYDQLFQQNASLTCEDCEWGYIDTLGQVRIKPAYTYVEPMLNGAGLVNCEGKWGMVAMNGTNLIDCQYDQIEFLENTDNRMVRVYLEQPKYGLIDTLGQLTVSAIYEEIGSFSGGRLAVKRKGLWGFVDRNGNEVISCRFKAVKDFSEGKAAARIGNRWGFIDGDGDPVIPFQYEEAGNFRDGLAWVDNGEGVGFINDRQAFIIPPNYNHAFDFQEGVARVVVDQEYGLIDREGRYIVKPRFADISTFDQYELAVVRYGKDQGRYGLINLEGQLITTVDYRAIGPFSEGLASAKTRQGTGFINTDGKLIIEDKYAKVGTFNEGRAMVQLNNRCGYIDQDGKLMIPCEYSRCLDFNGGRAVVYQGIKNAGIVGVNGEVIVQPSLDRLLEFQEGRGLMRDDKYRFYYITEQTNLYDGYYQQASAFRHGVAVVQIDGKWGIINQKGIEIIPPKYDHIDDFENGYAKVKIEGYNGLSNLDGELIVQPNYEFISYAGEGLFRVEQGDKVGYFDSQGNWVWELNR
ncbi:MAG: WG repeat-containing protein [Bacteroidota bacterium]